MKTQWTNHNTKQKLKMKMKGFCWRRVGLESSDGLDSRNIVEIDRILLAFVLELLIFSE